MTSGRPAFQKHTKRTEGSDTTPSFACAESPARRVKKQQHHQIAKRSRSPAGPRRLRNSDTHKRIAVPKAFCVLQERLRPRPKSGKVRCSDTRPGDVCERAERSEGSDSALPPCTFRKYCTQSEKTATSPNCKKITQPSGAATPSEQRHA